MILSIKNHSLLILSSHNVAYREPQPLDTVQDQLPQFWKAPLDSYPTHCHDNQYPQPQPLDTIEYQYLYESGPLTMYGNMIESSTDQSKSNGDSKKVDHTLCKNLTPRGVKSKADEEENEKRKRKKKKALKHQKRSMGSLSTLISTQTMMIHFLLASLIHTYWI